MAWNREDEYKKKSSKPFKNVDFTRLTIRALFISFVIGIAFAFTSWQDEGGSGLIGNFFEDIFTIFQFPSLIIFYRLNYYTWTTYVIGLLINAYLWSILIGIILYILSKFANVKNYYLFKRIGFGILIIGIILTIISEVTDFSIASNTDKSFDFHVIEYTNYSTAKDIYLYTGLGLVLIGGVLFRAGFPKSEKDISIR